MYFMDRKLFLAVWVTYSSKIALVGETRESRCYVISNSSEWAVPVAALEGVIQYTTSGGVKNPIDYVSHIKSSWADSQYSQIEVLALGYEA